MKLAPPPSGTLPALDGIDDGVDVLPVDQTREPEGLGPFYGRAAPETSKRVSTAYMLFSHTIISGSYQITARFAASQVRPTLSPPSPTKPTATALALELAGERGAHRDADARADDAVAAEVTALEIAMCIVPPRPPTEPGRDRRARPSSRAGRALARARCGASGACPHRVHRVQGPHRADGHGFLPACRVDPAGMLPRSDSRSPRSSNRRISIIVSSASRRPVSTVMRIHLCCTRRRTAPGRAPRGHRR